MRSRTNAVIAILIFVTCSLMAVAQGAAPKPKKPSLKVDFKVFKVVLVDGKETLQESKDNGSAKPGELLELTATYTNESKEALSVQPIVKVPVGQEYVPDAKLKAPDLASGSDGAFAPLPLKRKVMRNGAEVEELLPYSEYKQLQWNAGKLAPGATVVCKARVKMSEHK